MATTQTARVQSPTLSPYVFTTGFVGAEGMEVTMASYNAFSNFTSAISTQTPLQRFLELALSWKERTKFLSSTDAITSDDKYLQIIAMGNEALPYIFRDLEERGPSQWFRALRVITRANPVPSEARGNMIAMTNVWLEWAKARGYAS